MSRTLATWASHLYEEFLRPSEHQYFVRSPGPSTGGLGRDPPEHMIILDAGESLRSVNRLQTNLRSDMFGKRSYTRWAL